MYNIFIKRLINNAFYYSDANNVHRVDEISKYNNKAWSFRIGTLHVPRLLYSLASRMTNRK